MHIDYMHFIQLAEMNEKEKIVKFTCFRKLHWIELSLVLWYYKVFFTENDVKINTWVMNVNVLHPLTEKKKQILLIYSFSAKIIYSFL